MSSELPIKARSETVSLITIKSCNGCPLSNLTRDDSSYCGLNAKERGVQMSDLYGTEPPSDCPLRAGVIVMRFSGGPEKVYEPDKVDEAGLQAHLERLAARAVPS